MKTQSKRFQIGKDIPWETVGDGVQRQILGYDGQLMAVRVHFKTGGIGAMHEHYHSQVTYVVSGRFELTIDGEKKVLVAGDGYYVAPDELHGCICLEEGDLIDIFSPHRADFLKK